MTANEFDKQKEFIDQSIQSTLTAYQLQDVKRLHYEQQELTAPFTMTGGVNQLDNIPLWDNELLEEVYHQLQAITPYYSFTGVDAARYTIDGSLHQVYLAPREINTKRLPTKAKSWVNLHLKYTHGYGVVMSPAAQSGEERMSWFIHNMPPESSVGFEVTQPSIYYGLEELDYVIAPNDSGEFHYPGDDDDPSVSVNYSGIGGVPVTNLLRKTLFALYFNEKNIFFTQQTNEDSKIHFRRNIVERIEELTPFFQLDENPYLAVTSGQALLDRGCLHDQPVVSEFTTL